MTSFTIGIYLTLVIVVFMIAYAGVDGTIRVFTYLDLTLRFQIIKMQMKGMQWKMERQLGIPHKNYD